MKKIHPVTVLFLAAAPILAASTSLIGALCMSLAVIIVLPCSMLLLALLRKLIPAEAKLPAVLLTVAGFAAMAQLLISALVPATPSGLGVYLAMLAADLLLFSYAEQAFDRGLEKPIAGAAVAAAFFLLFTAVLAILRELFGAASFAGHEIEALRAFRIPLLQQPAGGLILFAVLLAVVNRLFPGDEVQGDLTRAAVGLGTENKEG